MGQPQHRRQIDQEQGQPYATIDDETHQSGHGEVADVYRDASLDERPTHKTAALRLCFVRCGYYMFSLYALFSSLARRLPITDGGHATRVITIR